MGSPAAEAGWWPYLHRPLVDLAAATKVSILSLELCKADPCLRARQAGHIALKYISGARDVTTADLKLDVSHPAMVVWLPLHPLLKDLPGICSSNNRRVLRRPQAMLKSAFDVGAWSV